MAEVELRVIVAFPVAIAVEITRRLDVTVAVDLTLELLLVTAEGDKGMATASWATTRAVAAAVAVETDDLVANAEEVLRREAGQTLIDVSRARPTYLACSSGSA